MQKKQKHSFKKVYLRLQSSKTGLCSWGLNVLYWYFYGLLPSVLSGAYVSEKTNKGAYISVIGFRWVAAPAFITHYTLPGAYKARPLGGSKEYLSGLAQDCGFMRRMRMMVIVVVVIITTTMKIGMITITRLTLYELTKSSVYLQ